MERSEPFIQPTLTKHFPGTVLGPGAATEVNGMNVVSPLEMLIKKVVSKAKKGNYDNYEGGKQRCDAV